MAAGASYEAYGHGQDATWQKSMSQIAELMAPREGEQVLSGPDRFDALYHPVVCVTIKDDAMLKRLSSAALSLRYLWLARFHERNGRWDPVYDWACARTAVHATGVPVDDDPSVWQPKMAQMLIDATDAIVIE